jgi:nitroreductase
VSDHGVTREDGMNPDELLTTTRSVRRRLDLDRPVSLDLVKECLRIALQAPTGSNAQRWRWLVIAHPDQRAAIAEFYLRAWTEYAASSQTKEQRLVDSATHLARNLGRVPVLVIPCLELASADLPDGNQAGLWGSLLPAAWSYALAARSRGLGTAWTTLHLRYEREVGELLGLPARVRQGVLLPTAHTIGDSFKPAGRRPLDEVLHVDRW